LPRLLRSRSVSRDHRTMFFRDPSGKPIEIEGFADLDRIDEH
jgi:extradiol dioxygenase family protein